MRQLKQRGQEETFEQALPSRGEFTVLLARPDFYSTMALV
jgi:hypothetical protein